MRIKVTPQCPANEEAEFQADWSKALAEAEEVLSSCLEQHLQNTIDRAEERVTEKIDLTYDALKQQEDAQNGDPLEEIKETLTRANEERLRLNEEALKRKREGKEANHKNNGPPSKKPKKKD